MPKNRAGEVRLLTIDLMKKLDKARYHAVRCCWNPSFDYQGLSSDPT
jgi:hypothetical protein